MLSARTAEETFADLANGLTKCMDCGKELKASHVLSIAARPESQTFPLLSDPGSSLTVTPCLRLQ